MDQQFATELKEALARRAADVPTEAVERVRGRAYRPRTSRVPRRLPVATLIGAATTAGGVVAAITLGDATAAFAGWTAAPTRATHHEAAAATSSCQSEFANSPALAGVPGTWNVVTSDVRGPFSVVVYEDGDADATCFTGPSVTMVSMSSANSQSMSGSSSGGGEGARSASASTVRPAGGASGIEQMTTAHLTASTDGSYTLVEGRLASDVSGVTLIRSDGSDVVASVGAGWFIAWWPTDLGVSSAVVTTTTGATTTVAIPAGPVGPPSCSPSASASTGPTTCSGTSPAGDSGSVSGDSGAGPDGAGVVTRSPASAG
jgi:hypothetical protein